MVNKNLKTTKKIRRIEKYIIALLLLIYIFGVCIGSYFVINNNTDTYFVTKIISDNSFRGLLYFFFAAVLKYAGVLNNAVMILPLFIGIENGAKYTVYLFNNITAKYKAAITILRDTTIVMLLIFYILIIITQIINKKFSVKKDIRYYLVYAFGVIVIIILEFIFSNFIFHLF